MDCSCTYAVCSAMWCARPSPFHKAALHLRHHRLIEGMVLQGLGVGKRFKQTGQVSVEVSWGAHSPAFPRSAAVPRGSAPNTAAAPAAGFPATNHCLNDTAKEKIEVARCPPLCCFSKWQSCAAVVPSSWWGHRYTPFTIRRFCSCYSSFWDPGTVFGQSMDLKQVAKCCCIFLQHEANPSGWRLKVADNVMNFGSLLRVSDFPYTVLVHSEISSAISQLFMTSR